MARLKFSDTFKRDAVRALIEHGHPVTEVSRRLGVSAHSLYEWKKKYAAGVGQKAEIERLQADLARVTEERDILKKAAAYFARHAG